MKQKIRCFCRLTALLLLLGLVFAACGDIKTLENGSLDLLHADLDPYIELGQYKELPISLTIDRVTEDEIESAFLQFTDSLGSFEDYTDAPVDRPTTENDFLRISFKGYYGTELFEGGSSEDESILLAENNGFIDWFEDNLYGVRVGDTVITSGTLPDIEGYGEMANKFVTFHITVLEIVGHYSFVEITDELVREKTGYDSIEAYKAYLGEAIEAQKKAEGAETVYEKVLAAAVDNATLLKYPEKQVEYHYNSFYSYYEYYAVQNGYTTEQLLELAGTNTEEIREAAEISTKEDLVFYAIVQAEKLTITDEEYAEGAAEYAAAQKTSLEALEEQYGKDYIIDCLLYDEMIMFLAKEAVVTYQYAAE